MNWLRTRSKRSQTTYRPSFDTLEARTVPTVTTLLSGTTLTINGSIGKAKNQNHNITITDNGTTVTVSALDGVTGQTTFTGIQTIQVIGGNKANTVSYFLNPASTTTTTPTTPPVVAVPRTLSLDLHKGTTDNFTANIATGINLGFSSGSLPTGSTPPRLSGLTINVLDGTGKSTNNVTSGATILSGGNLTYRAGGGKGRDTTNLTLTGDVNLGGLLDVNLFGSPDKDSENVNIFGAIRGTANVAIDGRQGNDTENITFSGVLRGSLNITANGGLGNDTINVNVNTQNNGGTGGINNSNGSVIANVNGGAGNDNLTLAIRNPAITTALKNGTLANVIGNIDGGAGNKDRCSATPNVTSVACEINTPIM